MGIITLLYLILWSILLNHFQNSILAGEVEENFRSIASVLFTQMGLQFSSMLISLITIMLSAGIIASELDTGMIQAIISRPIRRMDYVLGKFVGLCIFIVVTASILFFALLAIGAIFLLETIIFLALPQILLSWLLYLLVPISLICLTIYGSVSLKTVPCGLLMIAIYILGSIGGMVEMIGGLINNAAVSSAGIFLGLVSPFHIIYSTAERILIPATGLAGEMMRGAGGLAGSGRHPSIWMFVYIGFYCLFFVIFAVRKFEKIDII